MGMDYIFSINDDKILIESIQRNTKASIIEQYVKYRKEKGMTQEELARISGVSRPNIARFESGRYNPSLEMMVKIAAALGLKLNLTLENCNIESEITDNY